MCGVGVCVCVCVCVGGCVCGLVCVGVYLQYALADSRRRSSNYFYLFSVPKLYVHPPTLKNMFIIC